MTFDNPAGGGPEQASAYTRALLDLLGDRDPLAVQRRLVADLRAALAGVTDAGLRRPERPGKWSLAEVVLHLADSELVYGYRYRTILTAEPGDEPELPGYDQDAWATRLRYATGDVDAALGDLERLRAANLRLLATLDDGEWQRAGLHGERGRESVLHIARLLAAHDLVHLRQIERIKRALGLGPSVGRDRASRPPQ